MVILKCKMCGGNIDTDETTNIGHCQYCGSTMTLPKISDEKKANMYNRANDLRRNNEFDKALTTYENIISEDPNEAEAYWGIVLCKYGIEYVEDPNTHKRIPTCHRTQFNSILSDHDYLKAIEKSSPEASAIYVVEAKQINQLQNLILSMTAQTEKFDIFICYKESDEMGRRTKDSVLAQNIYDKLTQNEYAVFFARITLEDKIGEAYEPHIFSALNSSKIMLALGTKRDHFDAVWVKNEWSRFLSFIKEGREKTLIPLYSNMEAYDLPAEFAHLQAQDMNKIGAIQDLIRGIDKIWGRTKNTAIDKDINTNNNNIPEIDAILKRAYIFLDDNDFTKANDYFNRALDVDPFSSEGYWGLVLAENNCISDDEIIKKGLDLSYDKNFQKAVKFSNGDKNRYIDINNSIKITIINKLKQNLEQSNNTLNMLTQRQDELENIISEYQKQITNEKGNKDTLKSQYDSIMLSIDDKFSGEYNRLSKTRNDLVKNRNRFNKFKINPQIEEINTSMENIIQSKKAEKTAADKYTEKINNIESKLSELEKELYSVESTYRDNTKYIHDAKKQIEHLNIKLKSI